MAKREIRSSCRWWSKSIPARFVALLGVISPLQCGGVFTLAGFLRPGYSPIHQVISDLGVGPNGWIVNTDLVLSGMLFIIFTFGLYQHMSSVIRRGWLLASTLLLMISGVGVVNEGIFHQPAHSDPAAHLHLMLHGIGLAVLFYALITALFILGWRLSGIPSWRLSGWYLLLSALVTLGLVIVPPSITDSVKIAGLLERAQVVVGFSWSVVIGWRLFPLHHR